MRSIDADALVNQMEDAAKHMKDPIFLMATCAAINDVKRAPTIERKKGKWIFPNNPIAKANDEWICSECHYLIGGKHNYCPNCGADMRGGQNE